MRFNSASGIVVKCASATCDHCPNQTICNGGGGNCRNDSTAFVEAVKKFCTDGLTYYETAIRKHMEHLNQLGIVQKNGKLPDAHQELRDRLEYRVNRFREVKALTESLINDLRLNRKNNRSFTIPIEAFNNVFDPIKQLYWDEVVMVYLQHILNRFHAQCDSVLESAALFEKFIKTLAVADFMNNMEGNQ